MPSSTLMVRLREATDEIHNQIQELPYLKALERRDLPLESYVGQLRAGCGRSPVPRMPIPG